MPAAPETDALSGTDLEATPEQHMPEAPAAPFIPAPHPEATEISVPQPSAQALASPAVRARAKELGVDLSQVKAREGGRVRHADLDAYLTYHGGQGYRPAGATRADEAIKVVGLRRRIAENMAASKRHIPHFTYVEEIDVTALEAMRGDLNDNRGDRPKLTLLPLMIVALCKALPDFPMINARYDDEAGIVTRSLKVRTSPAVTGPKFSELPMADVWLFRPSMPVSTPLTSRPSKLVKLPPFPAK